MSFAKRIIERKLDARVMANAARGPSKGYQGKDTFRYDIFGDKELNQLFLSMQYGQQRNVLVAAFRKSAEPMTTAMKSGLRSALKHPEKSTGNLMRSIGAYAPRGRIELDVGARKFQPYAGYHAHLLEVGTEERMYIDSAGGEHRTGKMPPTFFFAKAVNATKDKVIGRFRDDRLKAFHDYVARQNKKNKT